MERIYKLRIYGAGQGVIRMARIAGPATSLRRPPSIGHKSVLIREDPRFYSPFFRLLLPLPAEYGVRLFQQLVGVGGDMPVDLIVDPPVELGIFRYGLESVPAPDHMLDSLLPVTVDSQGQGGADGRSHAGRFVDQIAVGWNAEDIGENLHEQLAIRAAAADNQVGQLYPPFVAHSLGVVFHGKGD